MTFHDPHPILSAVNPNTSEGADDLLALRFGFRNPAAG